MVVRRASPDDASALTALYRELAFVKYINRGRATGGVTHVGDSAANGTRE